MFSSRLPRIIGILWCLFLTFAFTISVHASPSVPVIFIHGLASDATAWAPFGDVLQRIGWTFGGCPRLDRASVRNICDGQLSAGDFYRLQFSDNENLTFDQQARELELIIDSVLALNPNKKQVILVGHSMGGLASRTYLQFPSIFSSVNKVLKLVTLGTPHQGSEVAVVAQDACDDLVTSVVCQLVRFFLRNQLRIEPFSVAMTELRPDSSSLAALNNLRNNPLPREVTYTSLIGRGVGLVSETILGFEGPDGDGIVTVFSQNLANVVGVSGLDHTAKSIPIEFCQNSTRQTHTCETTDEAVMAELLHLDPDHQAQEHMVNRAASDSRFGSVIPGTFGKDLNWDPGWELRWKSFNFAQGRVVTIYHATSKSDRSIPYTIFFDPDISNWTAWERALDLDEQAQEHMVNRAASDSRFGSVIPGTFGKDLNWDPGWELRWKSFNFVQGRVVTIYHATNKLDRSMRYTIFFDPDTGNWKDWLQAS